MSFDRASFADFFAAVRDGQRPFAWQERLLDHLLDEGRWPDRIVAPTGSGKTAVVDVHVFVTALSVAGMAPRLPRRLALVVARRVVVDSHDEHARSIATRLLAARRGVLAEVASPLRQMRLALRGIDGAAGDQPPLITARLRGGAPPPRSWLDEPEACAILSGTPEMLGSRLLLQGYGSSQRAWPREAGLLAFDTALVVDEAHLSRQLLRTARRVTELLDQPPDAGRLTGVPRLQVVETTATPAPGEGVEVGVDPADLDVDEALARRLTTPKPVALLELPTWPLPAKGKERSAGVDAVADRVAMLRATHGPTVGCVLNRVALAVDVAVSLRHRGLTVELLVGRLRPADVEHLRRRRPGLLSIEGHPAVDVLVATQTIEVGIDLDLSAMLTDLAPGAALAQRAGRVNRRGDRQVTEVIVTVPAGELGEAGLAPYERNDLLPALDWVRDLAGVAGGVAPWALRTRRPPEQSLRRMLLQRVELADSWSWAHTGDDVFARPDLALWLNDDLTQDIDVGVVVRQGLPTDDGAAVQLLRNLPPRQHEVFPVTVATARELLGNLLTTDGGGEPPIVLLRRADGVARLVNPEQTLAPGDLLVIDAGQRILRGGIVEASMPDARANDVLELATAVDGALQVRAGEVVLRWGVGSRLGPLPPTLTALIREGPAGVAGDWSIAQRQMLASELATAAPVPGLPAEERDDLREFVQAAADLLRSGRAKDCEIVVVGDRDASMLLILDRRRSAADEDIRQTWTPAADAVTLDRHSAGVAAAAEDLGRRLGLDDGLVDVLHLAGLHHDDGKRDTRFQLVLGATTETLAKSGRRSPASEAHAVAAGGLPRGWRHEQLSALAAGRALGESAPATRDLVVRLTGTSHGHGRVGFPHGTRSLLPARQEIAEDARLLFDEGSWEQLVDATDLAYGVWAMAYLEAVLRAADGRVSRAGS